MAQTNANLIWKIADLLRGPYQPNQYGDVILPFTILRRLDCILEPTKDEVLAEYKKIQSDEGRPALFVEGFLVDLFQFEGLPDLHADVVSDHEAS